MFRRRKVLEVNQHTGEEFDKSDIWFTCPRPRCSTRAAIPLNASYCNECGVKLTWDKDPLT